MWHITDPIRSIDHHTAGEPFRIVLDGAPDFEAGTVAELRLQAQHSPEIDAVRQLLCREPRGHADMYGCFIVPADDSGADFGALFWHNDGYSTACGHGTIALGVWAVQSARVASDPDGTTPVRIDVPSGRVVAHVTQSGGVVTSVVFENVPSYPVARSVPVNTSVGQVTVDLSFGGALYACLPASSIGLEVTPEHFSRLVALGREIKWALNDSELAHHINDERLSGVYGTILYDDLGDTDSGPHQRNVTVFGDGRADRSPCGSGTAARLALLFDDGRLGSARVDTARLASGQPSSAKVLIHDSIIGTRFIGRVKSVQTTVGSYAAIIPEVEGMSYLTGEHTFTLDPLDSLSTGFVLR